MKENGHKVDIVITKKDVLEELVKNEGWDYTNIFIHGRKINHLPSYISAGINFFVTIFRLYRYVGNRTYDLFITDDLLVYVGKIKKVASIVLLDDDLSVVKQFSLVLKMATHCLAPRITDLGPYESKKITFDGYKELAYLHPNHFFPDYKIVKLFNPTKDRYFIIRLVLLKSYHDVGKDGLNDDNVRLLVKMLRCHGKVFISSERKLPEDLLQYQLRIKSNDISHALYFADLYIGDSQTMSSEAAILGVPTFRLNDFAGKISVMNEKEDKYQLSRNYSSVQFDSMVLDISELLNDEGKQMRFKQRSLAMLAEKIDLSSYMIWLFENYPESVTLTRDLGNQQRFISSLLWKERQ